MKYSIITIFLMLLSFQIKAQECKQSVKKVMNDYGKLLDQGEIDKSLDYIYPAIFEIVSKEQMSGMFKQLLNSKDFRVKLSGFSVDSVGDFKVADDQQFVPISTSQEC